MGHLASSSSSFWVQAAKQPGEALVGSVRLFFASLVAAGFLARLKAALSRRFASGTSLFGRVQTGSLVILELHKSCAPGLSLAQSRLSFFVHFEIRHLRIPTVICVMSDELIPRFWISLVSSEIFTIKRSENFNNFEIPNFLEKRGIMGQELK